MQKARSISYTTRFLPLLILAILFLPVFFTNYAFTDEAHQLWHNKDHTNYSMFLVQGRWLSGLLFDSIYARLSTIASLKNLRLFSLFSWALFLIAFVWFGKRWQQRSGFSNILLLLCGVYIACSLSLSVYIGWAACFQAGMANLLAICGGSILFEWSIYGQGEKPIAKRCLVLSIFAGILSLLLYQVAFGTFLLPFAVYLVSKKTVAATRVILTGIVGYVITCILYYGVFLLSLKISGSSASNRTVFSTDIPGKLGFFFGMPLSQAFSFNFLYNTHSILSQAFPFLLMLGWLVTFFKMEKNTTLKKILFVVSFIAFCMLTYLPVLAGQENFSSYRTMFTLNLVVSVLLIDTILSLVQANKKLLSVFLVIVFTGVAFWNTRYNFSSPLQKEYKALGDAFTRRYHNGVDTIYFLRPPENAFYRAYGIVSYKDEFGLPSTYKDWTPEPLLKQLILEKTHNRLVAQKTVITQFTNRMDFENASRNKLPHAISLDPVSLLQ